MSITLSAARRVRITILSVLLAAAAGVSGPPAEAQVLINPRRPAAAAARTVPTRWSAERARVWYDSLGWVVGANFVPSTASNQLEMWQAATWDSVTIDRELGWADQLGMK